MGIRGQVAERSRNGRRGQHLCPARLDERGQHLGRVLGPGEGYLSRVGVRREDDDLCREFVTFREYMDADRARVNGYHVDTLANRARRSLAGESPHHCGGIDLPVIGVDQAFAIPHCLESVLIEELCGFGQLFCFFWPRGEGRATQAPMADLLPSHSLDHRVVVLIREMPHLPRLLATENAYGLCVVLGHACE